MNTQLSSEMGKVKTARKRSGAPLQLYPWRYERLSKATFPRSQRLREQPLPFIQAHLMNRIFDAMVNIYLWQKVHYILEIGLYWHSIIALILAQGFSYQGKSMASICPRRQFEIDQIH